ncbi:MAG: hypothetical protein HY652_13930, partial [Acidobacteria bacterium]|nr:hypothetical protein [Acidobacteriota bacterium]
PERERSAHQALLESALSFSPRVEDAGPGLALLDLGGLTRLLGKEENLGPRLVQAVASRELRATAGIGSNPWVALLAAKTASEVTVVPPGTEGSFLAPLPVSLLQPSPEIFKVLQGWGIRTLGELAALPEAGLFERLGEEGARLQKLARGEADRILVPHVPSPCFEESMEVEGSLDSVEPLAFLLASLLTRLCARLTARGFAAGAVVLALGLEDRTRYERDLKFPYPLREPKALLSLLRLELESRPPRAAVESISVKALPVLPRVVQFSLFQPPVPAPEKLSTTLARLRSLVGEENFGSPVLLDTHRPGAFRLDPFTSPLRGKETRWQRPQPRMLAPHLLWMKPVRRIRSYRASTRLDFREQSKNEVGAGLALRLYRPPVRAEVSMENQKPVWLTSDLLSGGLLSCAGPWRSSGDWWNENRWARDEWDVALDAGLYRIYRTLAEDVWYVEGTYD